MCIISLCLGCTNYSQFNTVVDLPKQLKEVSGVEVTAKSDLLWMHNDGGNKSKLYLVNSEGKIKKEVIINAKNKDWEDITSDEEGTIYIGDFGNNNNTRKDLVVLKIDKKEISSSKSVEVEKIKFKYPEQTKFPPKKKARFFDAESLFYHNGFLYILTKSRVKKAYGKTSLYKIPAVAGTYEAQFISSFENCSSSHCWITAASISQDDKKVALLTSNSVLLFTDFTGEDFFKGKLTEIDLGFSSQKEALDFKDNSTLYITDEKARGKGGKLYELKLPL